MARLSHNQNRLFLIGCKPEGRSAVNERLFDKPMGLYADGDRLIMSTRYLIWHLENRLAAGETHLGCDRLYVPSVSYTTGDLNVHDVVMTKNQKPLFINTDFSCHRISLPSMRNFYVYLFFITASASLSATRQNNTRQEIQNRY